MNYEPLTKDTILKSLRQYTSDYANLADEIAIAANGFGLAIVEYQISLTDLKKGENESNITPELIERLCFLLDSDSVKGEWERLNEIRGD